MFITVNMNVITIFSVFSIIIAAVDAPAVHVFPIIGQSNSVGFNSDGHTDEDKAFPNILQTSCCQDDGSVDNKNCKIIKAQDPLHHICESWYLHGDDVGFGMSFAREYRKYFADFDIIVLVPGGISGSGFSDNTWSAYSGTGFIQTVERIASTFKILGEQYPNHTAILKGYLWHQGENDASSIAAEYLTKDIIPMIKAFRDTKIIPQANFSTPFVVGNLVPSWVKLFPEISAALMLLHQYVPFSASTPSQGLFGDEEEDSSLVHFTAASQRIFGKRYYAAYNLALTNSIIEN